METRKKAENEAILQAMAAFRERAALMAGALGKQYRIVYMVLNDGPQMMPRNERDNNNMALMRAAKPMPIEAGESQVRATVSGTIELLD